jgi:hypothetical protein
MNKDQKLTPKYLSILNGGMFIPRDKAVNIGKKLLFCTVLTVGVLAIATFMCDHAEAATTASKLAKDKDVLSGAYTNVNAIMKGSFSKIITAVSLVFGLIGCALKFNPMAIVSSFGVGIAAGVGPTAIETLVSAVF